MNIFEFIPEDTKDCKVLAWLHTEHENGQMAPRIRPAMIVCPGGGYGMTSDREAEPIAQFYYAAGYQTFILRYSVGEDAKDFKPLCQLASTIAHVRKYADEWLVGRENIAVIGFSAGGHLAASVGTLFNEKEFLNVYQGMKDIRPNAMVLCYPVITSDEYAHVYSVETVSGCQKGTEGYEWFGLDKHVDDQTPPTFLWHTAEDAVVPVENSLKMGLALSKAKVPYELHIFPEGRHGMSACNKTVGTESKYNARWMEWSIQWLNKLFDYEN